MVIGVLGAGGALALWGETVPQQGPPQQGRTANGDTKPAAEKPAAPAVAAPLPSTAPIDVRLYGAKGDGTTDDTAAFQAAIEAARATSMTVYAPCARYLFAGRLNVPAGMTLEGSFVSVTSHPGGGRGGRGDRGGRTGQPDGTIFLVTGDAGKEDAPAFITLNGNSTLRGVAILYPEQTTTDTPKAYPYSVAMRGNNPAVLDVELINSYNGIDASHNQRHLIRNVSGQPLHIGVFVDGIMDIGRIENVHFNPWWGGGPAVRKFMMEKGEAFIFGRSDWEYVLNTFCFGYNTGYKFIRSRVSTGNCNGNFLGIGADDCWTAVLVEESALFGLLITNGEFTAFHGPDPTEVHVPASNRGSVRFVNCAFWGPGNQIAKIAGGTVGFSDCTFVEWGGTAQGKNLPAIQATAGTVIIRGCEFIKRAPAMNLGEGVRRAVVTGNVFSLPEASAGIVNKSTGNVQIGLNSFGAAGGGPPRPRPIPSDTSAPTPRKTSEVLKTSEVWASPTATSAPEETAPTQPAKAAKPAFDKNSPFYFDGTISRQRWKTIWIVPSPWAISWFPASRKATSFRIGTMMSA